MKMKVPKVLIMLFACIAIITVSSYPAMAGASAKYVLPILSLSESVSSISELEVALVDARTPTPSYERKDLLIVDGDYYQLQAGKAAKKDQRIHDNICSAALAGVPVVFVGPGYEELYADLGVKPQTVEVREGDRFVEMPCAIHAVKIMPRNNGSGQPYIAKYTIAGDYKQLTKNTFSYVRNWVNRTNSISEPAPIPLAQADREELGLARTSSGGSAYWNEFGSDEWNSGDAYSPKGQFNVQRRYLRLMNDNSYTYGWYSCIVQLQTVPGYVAYGGNGWRASHHYADMPLDEIYSSQTLIDYDPTTTSGTGTMGYSIGVTAGQSGASVSASFSESYSITDVKVHDYSNFYYDQVKWGHNINESRDAGKYTYYAKPGYTFRTSNSMPGLVYGYYQVCWAKKIWWWWQQYWQPEFRLADYMYLAGSS